MGMGEALVYARWTYLNFLINLVDFDSFASLDSFDRRMQEYIRRTGACIPNFLVLGACMTDNQIAKEIQQLLYCSL